jgi:hypothetical protein
MPVRTSVPVQLLLGLCLAACGAADLELEDAGLEPDAAPVEPNAPDFTRYPDEVRSPITLSVANRMRAIAARRARDESVFMKVGASGTVSRNLLFCFAGESQPSYEVDLDGREALRPTIDHFRAGDIDGATPFDRVTLAAMVGKTAAWVQSGSPSPLASEIAATDPRYAFVNYGTNDMEMATSYAAALPAFHEQLARLLDRLEDEGIVPIVTGLNPRADSAEAARWVPTYDAMTRAMAEARQLPYISLYRASGALPGLGLASDGLHGNVYSEAGRAQPCVFTADALRFNYNARNLLSMQALAAAKRVLLDGEAPPDAPPLPRVAGDGSRESPFVIDRLPFTHHFDTRQGARRIARWSCASQDEGGPEIYYRLALGAPTRVRAAVLHRRPIDVDVHLGDLDGGCVARGDVVAEQAWPAGEHAVVVDSFVTSTGISGEGAYLLVVHAL